MPLYKLIQLCIAISFSLISIAMAEPITDVKHHDELTVNPALTLHDVLEKTYARNPQQYMLQAMDGEVQARYIQARSLLPAAPAVIVRHINDTVGSNRGERQYEAGLELPIWLPGQRDARKNVADNAENTLAASRDGLLLQVAGVLRDAVWDISMNANYADLAKARYETAKNLQHDVERRYQAGELAKTDFMLAQNETLKAQDALVLAEAELAHAKHRYTALTGLEEIPANLLETLSTITELSDGHPLIREAESRISLAQSEYGLVNSERRENPQLTLSTISLRGGFDPAYNNSLGLSLRVPLDSEVRARPLMAASQKNLAQAMTDRERLRMTMETMLHEAEHNLEVTRAELTIVTEQNTIAQESLRLSRKAFTLGEIDLVAMMRNQALAYDAERALTSKQIQLQWDTARYNQAVGVLP
ncbi:TolC family protein [Methyloradius palustris]|uniref:Outer membrane efflux protein n=1 Tax=Methyloradius palustris TaxID=2778876 RepID=A0A8D5GAK2_9PROT|nr:TolC family protein [Methyloradius palustris]BCM24691.1 hypothetical protein ZMTM_09500 [Methyloradius palustris]